MDFAQNKDLKDLKDPPPEKLVGIVMQIIEAMVCVYERDKPKNNTSSSSVPPVIMAVTPDWKFEMCPSHLAQLVFDNPANKARLPWFARKKINESEGKLYALLAASEAWAKSLSKEEEAERNGREVCDYPDAGDALIVTAYTASRQWFWIQHMKDGKRDGEPAIQVGKQFGNLVAHQWG